MRHAKQKWTEHPDGSRSIGQREMLQAADKEATRLSKSSAEVRAKGVYSIQCPYCKQPAGQLCRVIARRPYILVREPAHETRVKAFENKQRKAAR